MNPYVQGIMLAREQRADFTPEENQFMDQQIDLLKRGIHIVLTEAELQMSANIKAKMDRFRYGDK